MDRITQRWYRPVALGLAMLILALGSIYSLAHLGAFTSRGLIGVDYRTYMEHGQRWLETGSMYASWQFQPYAFDQASGTNDVERIPALYPPIAGPVFAAVGFVPSFLWWLVPLTVIAYCLVRFRPAPWAWPVMALVTLSANLTGVLATGNSTMWMAASVAAGLVWGWPVLVIVLKPTLAPFLLLGIRKRGWWIGVAILAAVSLLMLPEWFRYVDVIRNATSPGLLYSVGDLPFVLVPVVAWLARPRPS